MTKQVIAIYLRLSSEDRDIGKNESNSIANQRQLILDYIQSNKALSECEAREFVDDGVSWARFDRMAFQEMIGQVRNGEIQIIITKDYSRHGMEYKELGKYNQLSHKNKSEPTTQQRKS